MAHPVEEIQYARSTLLQDKRIVMGITGSIAAVKCIELAHELIRHGAEVFPVMSKAAEEIVHPYAIHAAAGREPITKLTGALEHVALAGETRTKADLFLIAPATANTISKMAMGIDDTPVTTVATTALGSRLPTLVVPAMHASMYRHSKVMENLGELEKMGVKVMGPRMGEGKAKFPDKGDIVDMIIRMVGGGPRLDGLRGLVISGPTTELIDEVRGITNFSTGNSGRAFARALFRSGADVELWQSNGSTPKYYNSRSFSSVGDLDNLITDSLPEALDLIIMCAAVSDYTVSKQEGKIKSGERIEIALEPTPKLLEKLKGRATVLVAFKAEAGIERDDLISRAYVLLQEAGADIVVANEMSEVKESDTHAYIVDVNREVDEVVGSKDVLAERLLEAVARSIIVPRDADSLV